MNSDLAPVMTSPFVDAYRRIGPSVPGLAAAFLLLLAGMFTARALRTLAESVMRRAKLDDYTSKVGINEVLARLGLGKSPAYGISFLIYWFVLFIFIVSAANAVNMTVLSEMLERFMLFLPRMLAAILVLFGGLLFARFLSEIVAAASAANNVRGGATLARALYAGVLVSASITALEQLGLQMALLISAIQIILASAGLACALAFGLGGKEIAAELLRDALKRER
jgi:hypothetical protein